MKIKKISIPFLVSLFVSLLEASRMLVIFPMGSKSHGILGKGIVSNLLDAGHEVTYVTCYPIESRSNLQQVDISRSILSSSVKLSIGTVMDNEMPKSDVKALQEYGLNNFMATFSDDNFKQFIDDSKRSFDAVIVDYYENEIFSGLSALYDCPMIWAYSMGAHWQTLRLIDQPTNPAYTADYLSSNSPPFTFLQRLEELWAQIKWNWIKWSNTLPKEKETYVNTFKPLIEKRGRSLPEYSELIYNASLIFANEHHSFGNLPATPQNFKFIGGYHIDTPSKPLPQDLQNVMDNAKDGVIYFSMGSLWKSEDFPESVIEELVEMFGKLKQTVLWKFESSLSNLPSNLKIIKWAPQQSILAHPNCLFFITHGGILSSTEAIHFGVPVIGIPIFFDHFFNINKAVSKGYALRVLLDYDMPENLWTAIQEMLSNKEFSIKAKELSAVYHHRPVPPHKELVHWVEHVIRTNGAKYLRSSATLVPAYQKLCIDLICIFIAVIILIRVIIIRMFCKTKRSFPKRRKEKYI